MINSAEFDGMDADKAFDAIIEKIEEIGRGKKTVNYRLRDWLLSRQRYWGTPIPAIYCATRRNLYLYPMKTYDS